MAKPKRTREQAEQNIMTWLNNNNQQGVSGGRVFDFDKLGLLQIWWARFGWETRWLEVEKPPIKILS